MRAILGKVLEEAREEPSWSFSAWYVLRVVGCAQTLRHAHMPHRVVFACAFRVSHQSAQDRSLESEMELELRFQTRAMKKL